MSLTSLSLCFLVTKMNYKDVGPEFKALQFLFDNVATPLVSTWVFGLGVSFMAWDAWKRITEGGGDKE